MGERLRALWEHIRADIHRNPGLWIGVGLTAVVALLAYLAYRHQQNAQQMQVPANGYGIPDFGSLLGGGGGTSGGGYNPSAPVTTTDPGTPPVDPGTPAPPVAFPGVPTMGPYPGASGPASSGPASTSMVEDVGTSAHAAQTPTSALPAMQSVTTSGRSADNQRAHTGQTPTSAARAMASVKASGRTAQNQNSHRGKAPAAHPATHAPAHHYVVPRHDNGRRGRVA